MRTQHPNHKMFYVSKSLRTVRHWARLCSINDQIRKAIDAATHKLHLSQPHQVVHTTHYTIQFANQAHN